MTKAEKQAELEQRTITVPIVGYYSVRDGQIIDSHFDYATIPSKVFVEFILSKFGFDPERLLKNEY